MSLETEIETARKAVTTRRKSTTLSAFTDSCKNETVTRSALSVLGPYPARKKWRLVFIEGDERKASVFPTREEAEQVKERLLDRARQKRELTIGESLEGYRDYRMQYRGVKPETAAEHCRHLQDLLPQNLPILSLTPAKARKLYLDYAERPNRRNGNPISVNTHRWVLLIGKCWGKWCVKQKLLAANPFAEVDPIGKPNSGKPQLRIDEAKKYNRLLCERAEAGDEAAVGILLMLHLGCRQGEVAARVVRDVDADGRVLVIPFGKNEGSKRRLKVPEWLRPMLVRLTVGRDPAALLFGNGTEIRGRAYWWRKVHEYCEQAGVPAVCPHSLRGLHATLAITEGATCDNVARALGHGSFEMTAKHYASPDSVANAKSTRVGHALGAKEQTAQTDQVSDLIAALTQEQLQELRNRLLN